MTDFNDFKILRYKGPDAAGDVDVDVNDPDYFAEQESPNSGRYIVAGTATAGAYTLICTPIKEGGAASVTFTRVAESNTGIATGLFNAINAAVAADPQKAGIARYIALATNPSAGVVHVVFTYEHKHDFVVTLADPAPGTLAHIATPTSAGNRYPSARVIPFDRRTQLGPIRNVEVTVVAIDTNNQPLDPGACTYSMEFLEVLPRFADDKTLLGEAILTRGEDALTPLGSVHTVQCNGAHGLGVRMHTIANEPGSTDRFEIRYRAVVV